MTLGYDDDQVDEREASTSCTECGRPVQVAPDHVCRQCRDHCAVAAYRRAGAT